MPNTKESSSTDLYILPYMMELNLAEIFIVGWGRLEAIFEGRKLAV